MVRPHTGNPWGRGPQTGLGTPRGRRPSAQVDDAGVRLSCGRLQIAGDSKALQTPLRNEHRPRRQACHLSPLPKSHDPVQAFSEEGWTNYRVGSFELTRVDYAYLTLRETARQADRDCDLVRAGAIREALNAIDQYAVEELKTLSRMYGIADAPSIPVIQLPPVTAGPGVTVAAIPPPARTLMQFDWACAYRQLRNLCRGFSEADRHVAIADFHRSAERISKCVVYKFRKFGGSSQYPLRPSAYVTKTEQAYRAIEDMSRRATESGEVLRAFQIRRALEAINRITSEAVEALTTGYGALDALSAPGPPGHAADCHRGSDRRRLLRCR